MESIKKTCSSVIPENRIKGAIKIGFAWAIPSDAKKPADAKIKSGKYIKKPTEDYDDKS